MATSFVSLLPVFFSFEFLEFVPFFVILCQAACDQVIMVPIIYIYILEAFRFRSWYSMCFLFCCVLHPLPLSSCLGCIPPLIGLPSLRFYAVASIDSLFLLSVCFCLCFIFYRDHVLCWLLSCPFSSVCFPCLSPIPGLIWFGSVYLVTTAGFVADQLM